MINKERIKREIDDLRCEIKDLNSSTRLELFGMVIGKCFGSSNHEKTVKELKEVLNEGDPLLDIASIFLKGISRKN